MLWAGLALTLPVAGAERLSEFTYVEVDASMAGDCKAVADLNGDGFLDLVVGGARSEGLAWYPYPRWRRHTIAYPSQEFTTDCAAGDVDGDGQADLIVPDGNGDGNLAWFRNPGDARGNWSRHVIGTVGDWAKDVELADFNSDGKLDVAARGHSELMLFVQRATGAGWSRVPVAAQNLGREGLAAGDVDADGRVDLVACGSWFRNPGPGAPGSRWDARRIGDLPAECKLALADLDADGSLDLVSSSSEGVADITLWSRPGPQGAWVGRPVAEAVERAHTLQTGDMDGDGRLDVLVGRMHTAEDPGVDAYLARDGGWSRQVIDSSRGIHNGLLVDIEGDGDLDVFGANWTGNPPVSLWLNRSWDRVPLEFWTPLVVSDDHQRTFGLACGDLDGDGLADIASGTRWYRNPGRLDGDWTRGALPEGIHAFAVADLDADGDTDLVGQRQSEALDILWLEATPGGWLPHPLGQVPAASHQEGAQGYLVTQLIPGGAPEILVSSGAGAFYFHRPPDPAESGWSRVRISPRPSDEGLAAADLDGDGLPDVIATTGETRTVEWYRNPGDASAPWDGHLIGKVPEMVFSDRVLALDLDRDGRPEVVASEENAQAEGAATFWWRFRDRPDGPWERHLLTRQGSTNSLHGADMDGDGIPDLITAEHAGGRRLIIWHNDGAAGFVPVVVSEGLENHLGALPCDLDNDGDMDLVGIAWHDFEHMRLWRNDAITLHPEQPTVLQEPWHALRRWYYGVFH